MAKSTNHKPWCLLDDLLVPPLNGALSLIEVDLEVYMMITPHIVAMVTCADVTLVSMVTGVNETLVSMVTLLMVM